MKKIIIALALAALTSAPAVAEPTERRPERPERTQKADRAPNPYSNAEQARKRRIREAVREANQPRPGVYRFKTIRDRAPDPE